MYDNEPIMISVLFTIIIIIIIVIIIIDQIVIHVIVNHPLLTNHRQPDLFSDLRKWLLLPAVRLWKTPLRPVAVSGNVRLIPND